MQKAVLDKDLKKVVRLEIAAHEMSRSLAAPGLALVFLMAVTLWAGFAIADGPLAWLVVIAAAIAAYMALNIGANDVANNMGPAVGSRALTMVGALAIAAVFEAAGALLAGGDVVNTVARDLIRPGAELPPGDFVLAMMAALLAAALWINLATVLNAPVSTTHAIVGGVLGAGMAAAGAGVVVWPVIGIIAASWVVSPVLGGVIAAALLWLTQATITSRADRLGAARTWVPVLVALMAGIFAMYVAAKGLSRVWRPDALSVAGLGALFFVLGWAVARPWVARRVPHLENRNKHVAGLFRLPLVFAAALLSFAHGANDVANAVGPLAAIVAALETGEAAGGGVTLPLWVLAIGALGIAIGLALFGPRLIRTVGEKITRMNEIRAYCVALSAAVTVLAASALGLPVSSTHVAVGAIFGVGFLREHRTNRGMPRAVVRANTLFLDPRTLNGTAEEALANDPKRERRRLVRRQHAFGIAVAWVVTVPAAAVLSGLVFLVLGSLIEIEIG